MRRLLAVVLALGALTVVMPASAYGQEVVDPPDGGPEIDDPDLDGEIAPPAAIPYMIESLRDSLYWDHACISRFPADTTVQMRECHGNYTDQRWEFIFPGGQSTYFWIYHRGSNRCLSLKGVETGTPQNGYDAQMEPCEWAGATNGRGDDSVWRYSGSLYYRSRLGGRCLEWDTNYARYGRVQVWDCVAQPNAQWMVNEWG